ncbi:pannexin-2 isoform X2 [Misgurnus anguillicaudatus]|uniref:pannexin-2 isoform X2 n=1 Tax=Misgurnus anguillicaudatus TaxID=75329 RepID=UPI003CCFB3D4
MQNIFEQNLDMATALLAGEKLKELILPGSTQDEKGGVLAGLMVQLKLELPFDRVVTIGTVILPILLVTLVFTRNFAEESIYCYTPHNFTRDQALYARGYCWTELRDAVPGVDPELRPSLFEHKFLPYALLAFAGIMYIPALGWEFLASTRLTSELNFLLQEIDNCYHRAAEGRAPKIEKQIQSKGPGITERERREIIENAEKEKSPEQNLFEKYLERRGQSNFLAKLYLGRHLAIICLSSIPITYLSAYYARQRQNEFTCALGEPPDTSSIPELRLSVNCKLPAVQLQRIMAAVDIALLCTMNLIILVNLLHLFVEPLTLTRLDNNIKADKPKPVRRKNVPDSIMAPLLDSKSTQYPPTIKALETNNIERKQTLNLSLDVHPYMLTIQKAKAEIANPEPAPAEHALSNVYIEGPHTVLQVTSSLTEKKGSPPQSTTTTTFSTDTPSTASYMNGSTNSVNPSDSPKLNNPLNHGAESEAQPKTFSRNPSHSLLDIHHSLYEEEEQGRRDRLARSGELIAAGDC